MIIGVSYSQDNSNSSSGTPFSLSKSKSKNSPFINQDLSGRVKYTISNGQIATAS